MNKNLLRLCAKNPKSCAAAGAGVALAIYVAEHFDGSEEQRACIAACVPSNWDDHVNNGAAPEYRTSDDPDTQPVCGPGDDCENFCEARCKELHPQTPLGVAFEGIQDAISGPIYDALEALGLPMDDIVGIGRNIVRGVTWFIGFVVLLMALWAVGKVYAVFRMFGGGARKSIVLQQESRVPMGLPV